MRKSFYVTHFSCKGSNQLKGSLHILLFLVKSILKDEKKHKDMTYSA